MHVINNIIQYIVRSYAYYHSAYYYSQLEEIQVIYLPS